MGVVYVADTTGREARVATGCEADPDGWADRLQPGDPLFDDFLVAEYENASDTLSSGGATVIWVTSPCATDIFGQFVETDGENAVDSDRIRYVNEEILPRVVEARPAGSLWLAETYGPDLLAIARP